MNLAIIQARMGSTRLPNKVLMLLAGKTVLEHVIERVKRSKFVSDVLVATTVSEADLPIVNLCSRIGVKVFVGSQNDVLDRYYQAARLYNPRNIIRVTSDCPMIDPKVIDLIGNLHEDKKADYSSNTIDETYPDGLDAEIFRFEVLELAWGEAKLESEREHVTPFIKKNDKRFNLCSHKNSLNLSHLRWTIDQEDDFIFLSKMFEQLKLKSEFLMNDVLEVLNRNPGLTEINKSIVRNEGYLNSLKKERNQ